MNIYFDESGSFVGAPSRGSCCVVAAVAVPESDRRAIERAIRMLKGGPAIALTGVKHNELDEARYLHFLDDPPDAYAILFAPATDAGLISSDRLAAHQSTQFSKIREDIPRMRFEEGI